MGGVTWNCMTSSTQMGAAETKLYLQKWRWYQRGSLPWNRLALHRELARRRAFARMPLHGDAQEVLRDGWRELGDQVFFEPDVGLTAVAPARIRIGTVSFL